MQPVTDGSLADRHSTGNLLGGQALLVEAFKLLIARFSLGTSCRDRSFDLYPWSRTPFLDRYWALYLHRWRRFCSLRSGFELCEDTGQQFLHCFREVFGHMEPIGHLNRLGSTTRGGAGILAASIATHMGNFGMGLHPDLRGFCLTVWQQINDAGGCPGPPGRCQTFCRAEMRNHRCPNNAPALLAWLGEP